MSAQQPDETRIRAVADGFMDAWNRHDAKSKMRQREGIELAKQKGVYKGRKPSLTPEQVKTLRLRVKAGETRASLAREFGISRETVYQYAPVTA